MDCFVASLSRNDGNRCGNTPTVANGLDRTLNGNRPKNSKKLTGRGQKTELAGTESILKSFHDKRYQKSP
jgi:hypothetical protein